MVGGSAPSVRDLAAEAFAAVNDGTSVLDADEFTRLLQFAGRVNGPALLHDAWYRKRITLETLQANIGDVWSMAEYPDKNMPHARWRELFAAAGYTIDGKAAERPTEPIRLWRGAVAARRRDWSWTDNREVAQRYASGEYYARPQGQVWEVLAPPTALMCRNTGRDEDEYVVDTKGLKIVEWSAT